MRSDSRATGLGVDTPVRAVPDVPTLRRMTSIDARGPRFGAAITAAVLATALIAGPGALGTALIAFQTLVFAIGAIAGPKSQPYGRIYVALVQPRLRGPIPFEDAAPPRFAQTVGLVCALIALAGAVLSVSWMFTVAAAIALGAAFLNAVFDFCLGCEMYLLLQRAGLKRTGS